MDHFEARALQMAFDLTIRNTYEDKVGQGYNEARAQDIRRLYNILCGRAPEDTAVAAAPALVAPAPASAALSAPNAAPSDAAPATPVPAAKPKPATPRKRKTDLPTE